MLDISKDTQAILLLYGQWDKQENAAKPLTLSEYNRLIDWLKQKNLRPGDMLETDSFQNDLSFPLDFSRIQLLLNRGGVLALDLERWLNVGGWVLSRADEDYPKKLKDILGKYAPPVFYGVGTRKFLSGGGIAFVGSRDVSKDGEEATLRIGSQCARNHITVISGGARGVDQIAMKSSLDSNGNVIGVLSNDLSRLSVTHDCRDAIERGNLVLLSPFHPTAGFHVGNAMARNKVIYALSDATVVISSSDGTGGTWEGAVENLQKWRVPLFVRPDNSLAGNIHLIEKGAIELPHEAFEHPELLQNQGYVSKSAHNVSSTKLSGLDSSSSFPVKGMQKLLPFN